MTPTARVQTLFTIEAARRTLIVTEGRDIAVLDRSIISIAGHIHAIATISADEFLLDLPVQLSTNNVIEPDVHFVLVASDVARRRRCEARSSVMPKLFLSQEYNQRLNDYLRRFSAVVPFTFVDTTEPITTDTIAALSARAVAAPAIDKKILLEAIADTWAF